jgi:hypothetical protein
MSLVLERSRGGMRPVLKWMTLILGTYLRWRDEPNASSLSRALGKLTKDHLRLLQDRAASLMTLADRRKPRSGQGRLLAIDGMRVLVPRCGKLRRAFGCPRWGNQQHAAQRTDTPQALLVVLFDIDAHRPVGHAILSIRNNDEIGGARQLIAHLRPGDTVLLDRGLLNWQLLRAIRAKGAHFVLRRQNGRCRGRDIDALFASRKRSRWFCRPGTKPMSYRIVRGQRRRGYATKGPEEHVVIMTDLQLPTDEILRLYRHRWDIESFFKQIKTIESIEQFHGRTKQAIEREIVVIFTLHCLASALEVHAIGADGDLHNDPRRRRSPRALSIACIAVMLIYLGHKIPDKPWRRAIAALARQRVRKRPGRRFPYTCRGPLGRWRMRPTVRS